MSEFWAPARGSTQERELRLQENALIEDTQSNVLVLSGVRGDTRRYRTFHLYEQLRLAGIPATLSHLTDPNLPKLIERSSIIIFHRVTWDKYVARLFEQIHRRRALALLDADDLTFDPAVFRWINSPDFSDPIRAGLYKADLRQNGVTLQHCQGTLASTEFLAECLKETGKPAWVHRNAFSLEMLALSENAFKEREQHPGKIVIGYASGTATHDHDFELVRIPLQHLLQEYPQVEVWLVGPLNPGTGWEEFGSRVKRFSLVPWRELPPLLAQFDINLAPLVTDNPFAKSKSEIKYVEAGLVRVPTIASPTDAFRFSIRNWENGVLAYSTEEWEVALRELVSNLSFRMMLGEQAYLHTIDKYHPQKRSQELLDLLRAIQLELCDRMIVRIPQRQKELGSENLKEDLATRLHEQHPGYLEMGLYSLRNRSIITLLKQMWVFLRRAIAPIYPYRSLPKK